MNHSVPLLSLLQIENSEVFHESKAVKFPVIEVKDRNTNVLVSVAFCTKSRQKRRNKSLSLLFKTRGNPPAPSLPESTSICFETNIDYSACAFGNSLQPSFLLLYVLIRPLSSSTTPILSRNPKPNSLEPASTPKPQHYPSWLLPVIYNELHHYNMLLLLSHPSFSFKVVAEGTRRFLLISSGFFILLLPTLFQFEF